MKFYNAVVYKIYFLENIENDIKLFYYVGFKSKCFHDGIFLYNKNLKKYKSSSRDVNLKEYFLQNKKYVIEILNIFDSNLDALAYEKKYHEYFNVVSSIYYFNKSIATTNNFCDPSYASFKHVSEGKVVRLKKDDPKVISGEYVGVTKNTKIQRKKMSFSGSDNPFYGKKHSAETKKVISDKAKQRNIENPTLIEKKRELAKKTFSGVPKTEEHKKKIGKKNQVNLINIITKESIRIDKSELSGYDREVWMNPYKIKLLEQNETVECVYCGYKTTKNNTFYRWHNDRCKKKQT